MKGNLKTPFPQHVYCMYSLNPSSEVRPEFCIKGNKSENGDEISD